jgi:hypothetical protein
MIYAYDIIPSLTPAKGNQYLNNLLWVIYDRLTMFTQMGTYLEASAKRGVALTQEE